MVAARVRRRDRAWTSKTNLNEVHVHKHDQIAWKPRPARTPRGMRRTSPCSRGSARQPEAELGTVLDEAERPGNPPGRRRPGPPLRKQPGTQRVRHGGRRRGPCQLAAAMRRPGQHRQMGHRTRPPPVPGRGHHPARVVDHVGVRGDRADSTLVGSLTVVVTIMLVRPFVQLVVLVNLAMDGRSSTTVVPTGLMPVTVRSLHGTTAPWTRARSAWCTARIPAATASSGSPTCRT